MEFLGSSDFLYWVNATAILLLIGTFGMFIYSVFFVAPKIVEEKRRKRRALAVNITETVLKNLDSRKGFDSYNMDSDIREDMIEDCADDVEELLIERLKNG